MGRGCGVEEDDLRCCGPFEEEEDGPAVIEDDVEACDCAGPVEPDAKAEEGDPERECAGVVRAVAGSVFDPPFGIIPFAFVPAGALLKSNPG